MEAGTKTIAHTLNIMRMILGAKDTMVMANKLIRAIFSKLRLKAMDNKIRIKVMANKLSKTMTKKL